MKTDSPDPPPDRPSTSDRARPTDMGNATQVIDLAEVELLVAQQSLDSSRDLAAQSRSDRSLPPPLPADVRASALPGQMGQMGQLSAAPPAPRSNAFFIVAILGFLVIGVGGGLVIAMLLRKPAPPAPAPAVITIPTVEMNDTDAGQK